MFLPVSERQSAECRSFCQFCLKLVAKATSLKESEKEVQIDHIHANTYHLVAKKIVKSV